jgi:hypothetical protein
MLATTPFLSKGRYIGFFILIINSDQSSACCCQNCDEKNGNEQLQLSYFIRHALMRVSGLVTVVVKL